MSDYRPVGSGEEREAPVTDHALKRHSQELGVLGKIFGGRDQAPINMAGAFIFICAAGLLSLPFTPETVGLSKGDIAKALVGLIVSSFTFLGGYLGGSKRTPD